MIKEVIYLISSDLYRYSGDKKIKSFFNCYKRSEGFRFSVWLRLCYCFRRKYIIKYLLFPICRCRYKHYKYKYGYDIPYDKEIGPGLLIFHIGGIVFSPEKCGRNMTISQNTTVGMTVKNGKKCYPVFGDNTYLAPGSAVIGGVTIGNNIAIGTNCVLTKSVDDNAVVVGIPGEIISYNGAANYINNPIE